MPDRPARIPVDLHRIPGARPSASSTVGEDAAQPALEQAQALGDLGHQADAHAAVADIAQARGDAEAAERHYRAARDVAERAGNLLALCAAQIKTARLWTVQGRYAEALALNDAATELADRIGFAQMRSEGRHVRARYMPASGGSTKPRPR